MLLFMEVTEKPYKDIEELKRHWRYTFKSLQKDDPSLNWEEFKHGNYYDRNEFILDTDSGKCYDANEFYHLVNDAKN